MAAGVSDEGTYQLPHRKNDMRVLVLNCGSSSLKFQVIESDGHGTPGTRDRRLARGTIERIGGAAVCTFGAEGEASQRETTPISPHADAVEKAFNWLRSAATAGGEGTTLSELDAVGHRVVHGGDQFTTSVILDDDAIAAIEALNELAPLHNPPALQAIRACRTLLGDTIPMVAAFDTAFHQTLPPHASAYALPHDLAARHGIRRYGFHGLAHRYVSLRYAEITHTPREQVNIITLHLGNGCSACAIRGGISVDTSMGFTPLEGLVMGTRTGDLDPAIVSYLVHKESVSTAEVEMWLNERSGLLGVSGRSNDMRELLTHAAADGRARLAIDLFCYRARKYIGAYLAVLGGATAVVFSGGIGERSPLIRAKICEGMQWCGLELDPERNTAVVGTEGAIALPQAAIQSYVIPSDEEHLIARDTVGVLRH
jgi:acetate kinase